MAILTCQCKARVRVPDDSPGPFKCPRCQSVLEVPVRVPTSASVTAPVPASAPVPVGAGAAPRIGTRTFVTDGSICPTCQTPIGSDEPAAVCPTCKQAHHEECWNEVGGCAIYGCEAAPQFEKNPDTQPITSAWGDFKSCPMCGEQIKAIALKCRYCNANFDTVDPLSVADLRKRADRVEGGKSIRTTVIVLFAFSVIGLLAPIMLLVTLIWVLKNRENISRVSPGMLVLGYAAIGLSAVYTLMMVVLIATS